MMQSWKLYYDGIGYVPAGKIMESEHKVVIAFLVTSIQDGRFENLRDDIENLMVNNAR